MKKFYCPAEGDGDCPYYQPMHGTCGLVNEGYDPVEECDVAAFYYSEDCEDEEEEEEEEDE